jgi:hypothetical protein
MMGERQTDPPALFYEFSLERHVAGDRLLRSIRPVRGPRRDPRAAAAVLQLRPFYSDTGRPSDGHSAATIARLKAAVRSE